MRVACSRCKTAHDIPPEKLTDEVLKIRCTRCGHVFGVRKKKEESAPGKELPSAPGAAAPPPAPLSAPSAAPTAPPPRPVRPPLPDDSFEEEEPHDIHWLDEIDIPKIDDVIQAVQKKMAAAAAASTPAVSPAKPKAVQVQTPPVTASPAPQPAAKPVEIPPPPQATPLKAEAAPHAPRPQPRPAPAAPPPAAKPEEPKRPATKAAPPPPSAPRREPAPRAPDAPPPAVSAPARRRVTAAGVAFLSALLLCAGAAGFVASTRPETFALLASRLADPMGSAEEEFVLDEPLIGAQLSRPDKRPLFVITGWIRGVGGAPLPSSVRVESRLYGVGGVELASGEALCGTLLTEEDLVTLADSEIVSRLQRAPSAAEGAASRIPFMIVIPDPPRGVESHAERIVPPGAGG